EVHFEKSERAFERDVYPALGNLPVADITPAMVARVVESIATRARDTAGKGLQHVGGGFRFAQAPGLRHDNPADPASEILPARKPRTHLPALLTFAQLGEVLRAAERAQLRRAIRMAHLLLAYAATIRISNVVQARWQEFHLDADVPV